MLKSGIEAQNVDLMQWAPQSPDTDVIKNGGWLGRKVFESGGQYFTKEELIEYIKIALISLNFFGNRTNRNPLWSLRLFSKKQDRLIINII